MKSPWKSMMALEPDREYVVPLAAFADQSPHHERMAELSPEMGPTKFVRWTIAGSDGRPSWKDALRRLA